MDNLGDLGGDVAREAIDKATRHLDRRGTLSALTFAGIAIACVVVTIRDYGTLWQLLPVTVLVALIIGGFLLMRWRLAGSTHSDDSQAPVAVAADDKRVEQATPAVLGTLAEQTHTLAATPTPRPQPTRPPIPPTFYARAQKYYLVSGVGAVAGYLAAYVLFSATILPLVLQGLPVDDSAFFGNLLVQMSCMAPLAVIPGGIVAMIAVPLNGSRSAQLMKPMAWRVCFLRGLVVGFIAYVPMQFFFVCAYAF